MKHSQLSAYIHNIIMDIGTKSHILMWFVNIVQKSQKSPIGYFHFLYTWIIFILGIGALRPYIPLYFKTLGLTPKEMSLIIAVMPISSAICTPIVTTIADKWNCHRLVLAVVALISAGTAYVYQCMAIGEFQKILSSWKRFGQSMHFSFH